MSSIDSNLANKYFGKRPDSRGATELMKSNPVEYARIKEIALREGLIHRSEWMNPAYRDKFNPRQFSQDELTLLAEIPESESAKFYGAHAQHNAAAILSKMSTEEPGRYNSLRRAAQLRGQIATLPSQPTPQPKPVSQFFRLNDELADKANLPRGYETNASGLETILKVLVEVREQKREAEERAAKSEAQQARDLAADASVAEFGRLLEQNRVMSAKQRERDAASGTSVTKIEVPIGG